MYKVVVLESALKHGLTEEQILQAWDHAIERTVYFQRDDGSLDYKAIGFDANGKAIELGVRVKGTRIAIFHANAKLTVRMFRELGMERRRDERHRQ